MSTASLVHIAPRLCNLLIHIAVSTITVPITISGCRIRSKALARYGVKLFMEFFEEISKCCSLNGWKTIPIKDEFHSINRIILLPLWSPCYCSAYYTPIIVDATFTIENPVGPKLLSTIITDGEMKCNIVEMCITYSEDINCNKSLLESIPLPKNQPTTIISDNTAAIDSALSVLPRGSVQALCA